jgi:hypothetical protein
MSPGRSSGTRTLVTQASNQSPLIGPSSTIGATMLSGKRMPANGARNTLSKTSRSSTTAQATVDHRDDPDHANHGKAL